MGASKDVSVVDENGETWNCEGLYVCDASVFPTNSGVNPMLTTLAIADGVADVIAKVVAANGDGGKRHFFIHVISTHHHIMYVYTDLIIKKLLNL